MKLGLVTQWFDPESGSAMTFGTIARALRRRGIDVAVLTGLPNYPTGTIYPGYRQRFHRETLEGVVVHRVPLFPSHDARSLHRILNYLSFAVTATMPGVWSLRDRDVNLAVPSPPTAAVPALAAKLLFGTPYVLHIHDLWPDSMTATGMLPVHLNRPLEAALGALCSLLYRHASAIAVISPGMRDVLISRGVPSQKLSVVPNWANENLFRPHLQSTPRDGRSFTVMYAGAMGPAQALECVVEAAGLLASESEVVFHLVGSGPSAPGLKDLVSGRGLTNVVFSDPVAADQIPELMAQADLHLISLADVALFRHTMPSKVQSLLASGVAVLGIVAGDAAAILSAAGAAVVKPGDAPGIAAAIAELARANPARLDGLRQQARRFYVDNLSEERSASLLKELCLSACRLDDAGSGGSGT